MLKPGKEYVGIILTEDVFKIAHLKGTSSGLKLIGVSRHTVNGVKDEELLPVLQAALRDLNMKKAQAVCTVSSSVVLTKNIEIPSLDPEEIKSIIDLQAGRHTPYSREEILIGYIPTGVFQKNYTKVLLIIVKQDVVKKQLDIFSSAMIKVDRVFLGPEATACFYAQMLEVKEGDNPVGIIDIASQSTDFIIEFNKTVATCRNIPVGASHLHKEGTTARNKLVEELVKSLEAYQNEDIHNIPQTYILTRDDPQIKELQPVLKEKLKAEIKFMPYLEYMEVEEPVKSKLASEYSDESFLNVIAAASVLDAIKVDLVPEEIKIQKTIEDKGRELIKVGAFSGIIFVLVFAIFFSKIYFKSIFLGKLEKEHLAKRKAVASLDRVAQKTRIIKGYLGSRMVTLDVMNEIYQKTPDEIYLKDISFGEDGKVNVRGTSESMSRVFNYITYLEDSTFFKGIKTKSTSAKKERGKDVAVFEIEFKLESASDDEENEETKG